MFAWTINAIIINTIIIKNPTPKPIYKSLLECVGGLIGLIGENGAGGPTGVIGDGGPIGDNGLIGVIGEDDGLTEVVGAEFTFDLQKQALFEPDFGSPKILLEHGVLFVLAYT